MPRPGYLIDIDWLINSVVYADSVVGVERKRTYKRLQLVIAGFVAWSPFEPHGLIFFRSARPGPRKKLNRNSE
jgi:hypothetical protein